MSDEWGEERMDRIPVNTLVDVADIGLVIRTGDSDDNAWFGLQTSEFYTSRFLAEMGPPKVVSVPIDALLSDGAAAASVSAQMSGNSGAWSIIRAAIVRVIGGNYGS